MTPSELKQAFRRAVGDQLIPRGYAETRPGIYEKRAAAFDREVRVIFVGRALVEANIIVGFKLPKIDAVIEANPSMQEQIAATGVKMPTVFAPAWVLLEKSPTHIDRSLKIDGDLAPAVKQTVEAVVVSEAIITSLSDLASFVEAEHRLALGHHAFRVPLVLRMAGRHGEFADYMSRVQTAGVIPGYQRLMKELLDSRGG